MPVTLVVPVTLGENVTKQLPLVRVQLAGVKAPDVPVVVNVTVPVGVEAVPTEVSATVAAHVEP